VAKNINTMASIQMGIFTTLSKVKFVELDYHNVYTITPMAMSLLYRNEKST